MLQVKNEPKHASSHHTFLFVALAKDRNRMLFNQVPFHNMPIL